MEFLAEATNDPASLPALVYRLRAQVACLMRFIAARDATLVFAATDGVGTNDELLTNILCNRTKDQINAIDEQYRNLSKNRRHQSLRDCIKSETSGNYGDFLQFLTQSRGQFLAEQLHVAMDGIGCNKSLVNEIFCTATTADIRSMRATFESAGDNNLADRLRSELGGEHEKLILFLLQNGRPDAPAHEGEADGQAEEIHQKIKKGSSMMGGLSNAAEEDISKYLASLSAQQMAVVKDAWDRKFGSEGSLEKVVVKKFGGALEEACVFLLHDPLDIEAKKLRDAMEGIGSNDRVLSRILGGAHKHTAVLLAQRYMNKYNENLRTRIGSETGGHLKTALLTWLMGTDPTGALEPTLQYYDGIYPRMTREQLVPYADLLQLVISNIKHFIASLDADLLYIAGKGIGTDESVVISILCARTKAQLDAIDLIYRERYHQSLKDFISSELSGDLGELLSYTQLSEVEFDAAILHKAFTGIGCDKELVIEVACTRSAARLQAAKEYYTAHYDENFMDRLRGELGGGLEYLVVRLFTGGRGRSDDSPFDAEIIAQRLHDTASTWGSDTDGFTDILTSCTVEECKQVAAAYERLFSTSLEATIKSEFRSVTEKAFLFLINDPIDNYCRLLKDATDGLGTTEAVINRILGGNDKSVLHRISRRYFEKYNEDLTQVLSSELFHDHRTACVTIVQTSDVTDGEEDKLAALVIQAHDPPPPPTPARRVAPPKPVKEKKQSDISGKDVAIGAALVVGFTAATLLAGPPGAIVFGIIVLSALSDDKNGKKKK